MTIEWWIGFVIVMIFPFVVVLGCNYVIQKVKKGW